MFTLIKKKRTTNFFSLCWCVMNEQLSVKLYLLNCVICVSVWMKIDVLVSSFQILSRGYCFYHSTWSFNLFVSNRQFTYTYQNVWHMFFSLSISFLLCTYICECIVVSFCWFWIGVLKLFVHKSIDFQYNDI